MGSQAAIEKAESELLTLVDQIDPRARRRARAKRMTGALLAGAAVIALGAFSTHYWTTGRFLVDTDDAYVAADSTAVAPKVSGYIKDVLVTDNQPVHAGQVLARIDDADFQTAVQQADATVASAEADIANLKAQIEQQHQEIAAARSNIASDQAVQQLANQDHQRYADLVHTGYGTVQRLQQAEAAIRQANASVSRDQANLAAALKQSDVLQAQLVKAKAVLTQDEAAASQARLNLGYTTITAAIDGAVGARSLRVGSYVQAGTQLMQIVPLHQVYVTANFKETQLADVQPGQPVKVHVDSLPGVEIAGTVDSLAPASGQQFALLPPDNATGNFTKIVQRIPVKIALDQTAETAGRLRPGMSVEAEIDTKASAPGHLLASND
jgi:membrane fusion protein (multidrug efflux system)